ncbi:hypothetical protein DITRI_Ditri14bG0060100 [Diplodiscus trichospermus]
MYSCPILVCTGVSIRFYLKIKYPEFQWMKRKDSKRSSAGVNRSIRNQKSVRRNARKEVVEWDRKHSEERDILFPRSPCNSLSCKTDFLEETSKLIFDVKRSSTMENGESSSHNKNGNDQAFIDPNSLFDNETSKPRSVSGDSFQGRSGKGPGGGGGGEVEVESLEEADDEEDEQVHEDGNKAVEWTEDDQKNLMDLGLSELERNKRLESLIAKRRAKKLFKMAVEKSLMDMNASLPNQIAPILIVKNNLLGVANNLNDEGQQMPGSAPSILLPTENPFDLPYDPLEEKPNLMADSFHQEFMAANQKEMLFCRHESFSRGPLFTLETTQYPKDDQFNPYYSTQSRLVEGATVSAFKRQPDKGGHHQHNSSGIGSDIDHVELEDSNHNKAINSLEQKQEITGESANDRIEVGGEKVANPHDLEPGLDIGTEVRMETDSIKNNDSCYSSSSEANESVLDQTIKSPGIHTDQVRKAFNLSIPPKGKTVNRFPYDSSPSPSERRRTEFNLFYSTHRRHHHTPTCSIASDLQVELSEVGSPTLTTETVSSVDGDSVTYDGDVERDINSDSEELWGGSFNLSRGETNREKLRELHDIIEEDSVEVEILGLNRKPEELIASFSPFEQEAKQNLDSTSSLSSIVDITDNGASHPTNINPETHEDAKKTDEEVEGCKTFNVSNTLSTENPGKTMYLMEKPEQLIERHQKPTEELNIICNVKPITQGDSDTLDSKPSENRENEAQILTEGAAVGEITKPAEAINSHSSEYRHGNLETPYESKTTMESEKVMGENQPSKYIKEDTPTQEDTQNLESEHDTGGAANAVQSRDDLKYAPDSIVHQNVAGDNVSGEKQRFAGSIAMAINPRLLIEQISVSSFSSPRSVLPQNILEDQIPISDVEHRIQTDVPQSVIVDITRHSLADDHPQENLTFSMLQNAQQLFENSIDHSSSNSSYETLEGSSNMTEKTTNYGTGHNTNEDVLEDTHGKEGSSIKANEGESRFSIRPEVIGGPEKSNEHEADVDKAEANESKNTSTPETARGGEHVILPVVTDFKLELSQKSAAEVDLIGDVNDSSADNASTKEIMTHVLDGEAEPQLSSRQEAAMVPSKTIRATSAVCVEHTEREPKRLITEANAGLSTSAGESNSLNNIKNDEDIQNLTGHEGYSDVPQSWEDNLNAIESTPDVGNISTGISVNHKVAREASKPTESEAKAVYLEENESNAVAK